MATPRESSTTFRARWREIAAGLADKAYRDAFVEQEIRTSIPFQIRALRLQRELSQDDLGRLAEMAQGSISLLENPAYGRMNLGTLLRLASAFDVGLMLRFVPFSDLVDWADPSFPKARHVPSYVDDERLFDASEPGSGTTISSATSTALASVPLLRNGRHNVVPLFRGDRATETSRIARDESANSHMLGGEVVNA